MATSEQLATLRTRFRDQFPEFSAYPDGFLDGWLEEAISIHSRYPRCTTWCCAHLIALWRDATGGSEDSDGDPAEVDAGSKVLEAEDVGKMGLEYSRSTTPSEREQFFGQTYYGRHFMELERRAIARTPGILIV